MIMKSNLLKSSYVLLTLSHSKPTFSVASSSSSSSSNKGLHKQFEIRIFVICKRLDVQRPKTMNLENIV